MCYQKNLSICSLARRPFHLRLKDIPRHLSRRLLCKIQHPFPRAISSSIDCDIFTLLHHRNGFIQIKKHRITNKTRHFFSCHLFFVDSIALIKIFFSHLIRELIYYTGETSLLDYPWFIILTLIDFCTSNRTVWEFKWNLISVRGFVVISFLHVSSAYVWLGAITQYSIT